MSKSKLTLISSGKGGMQIITFRNWFRFFVGRCWVQVNTFSRHVGFVVYYAGTQTFRPIVSLHHYLVRGFAPNSYSGKTFRTRPIHRKDVSPPCSYFRKTFRTLTILQKDVSHPNHISERRFAPISKLGKTFSPLIRKTFRPLVIIWKDVSNLFHI